MQERICLPISTWPKPGRESPCWVQCVCPALGALCQALPVRLLCKKPRFFCKVEKFPLSLREESPSSQERRAPARMGLTLRGSEVTDEPEREGDAFGHIRRTSQTEK